MKIFIILFYAIAIYLFLIIPDVEKTENEHVCTTYVRCEEHYMITPMTWSYRDSFKCTECGKDYKELEEI